MSKELIERLREAETKFGGKWPQFKEAADAIESLTKERDELRASLITANANEFAAVQINELRASHDMACRLVAKMHEAAMGKICGPITGPVEDIAALRIRAEKAEATLKQAQEHEPICEVTGRIRNALYEARTLCYDFADWQQALRQANPRREGSAYWRGTHIEEKHMSKKLIIRLHEESSTWRQYGVANVCREAADAMESLIAESAQKDARIAELNDAEAMLQIATKGVRQERNELRAIIEELSKDNEAAAIQIAELERSSSTYFAERNSARDAMKRNADRAEKAEAEVADWKRISERWQKASDQSQSDLTNCNRIRMK